MDEQSKLFKRIVEDMPVATASQNQAHGTANGARVGEMKDCWVAPGPYLVVKDTSARMHELLRNVHHFLMHTNGNLEERHALLIKVQDELDRG